MEDRKIQLCLKMYLASQYNGSLTASQFRDRFIQDVKSLYLKKYLKNQ